MKHNVEPHEPNFVSICPRCFREVSNKAYFAGPKGSAHFRGTCSIGKSRYFLKAEDFETIAERDVRKVSYPMPPAPDYDFCREHTPSGRTWDCPADCKDRVFPVITTYADLAKWWGLDKPKKAKPLPVAKKETAKQWIKAHPEIAHTNRLSRVDRTLAKMGLAA